MREELKSCEHKQTIVVDNSLAEWCEDCGAFRIKKGNIWWWGEWYYPNTRPAARVPSKRKIRYTLESFHGLKIYDSTLDDMSDVIHALLTERK